MAVHPVSGVSHVARRGRRGPDVGDLFGAIDDLGIASVVLESIVRPAYVVPETKDPAVLLHFRREKQHMAIVVDEYGDMEGIYLEDILEKIVGDIEDEFDLRNTSIEHADETTSSSTGRTRSTTSTRSSTPRLEQEDFSMMAGLVSGELGRAPEVGDEVRTDGLVLTRARDRGLANHENRGRVRRGTKIRPTSPPRHSVAADVHKARRIVIATSPFISPPP